MQVVAIISLVIIVANFLFSYKGFKDYGFFRRYVFQVDRILIGKEYDRMITSGFLHLSWPHLIFNMLSLYLFSDSVEMYLGAPAFFIIYFASLLGGNLLALFIHRNHADYTAAGASGAVCGVIFASLAVFPGMSIFFLPGWLYGLLFVGFSIYAIKNKSGNVGHEAHLGGALLGMLVAIAFHPQALLQNYITILLILIPTVAFLFLIVMRPHILLIEGYSSASSKKFHTVEDRYNIDKNTRQATIDAILEKISSKGIKSLTQKEKEILDSYSKK